MAVARAPGRGGITSIHVALIAFVAVTLTATVLLVLLYTDQEALKNERDSARAENNKLITTGEQRSIPQYGQAKDGGPTMSGLLERARSETAKLITPGGGAPEVLASEVGSAQAAAGELIRRIEKDQNAGGDDAEGGGSYSGSFATNGLLDSFKALTTILDSEHKRLVAAEDEKRRLTDQAQQLARDLQAAREEFERKVADFNTLYAALDKNRADYQSKRDQEFAGMMRDREASEKKASEDIQKLLRSESAARESLSDMNERYQALRAKLGEAQIGPQALASARQPDGRVVTAKPGDEVVYIDIGEGKHLAPGMNFAVYPGDAEIPANGRAKARLQVQRIFARSSECRVMELLGNQVVLEHDQIANPVYDRNKPLKFRILGEFDLNNDGHVDPDAPAIFEAMITNWGGTVVQDLAPDIDFVVLGVAPRRPTAVGTVSPEQKERDALAQRLFDEYNAALEKSRNLSIPLLLEDVFLSFLGYGNVLPASFP